VQLHRAAFDAFDDATCALDRAEVRAPSQWARRLGAPTRSCDSRCGPAERIRRSPAPDATDRACERPCLVRGPLRVLLIGDGKNLPAPVVLIAGAATAVVIWWNATKWSPSRSWWTPEHTYAVIAGALPTSWLLGFLIAAVSGGSIVLNLAGHAVFGVLIFVALHALHRRIRQTQPDARVQPAQAGLAT
jgi:hypothetical protein